MLKRLWRSRSSRKKHGKILWSPKKCQKRLWPTFLAKQHDWCNFDKSPKFLWKICNVLLHFYLVLIFLSSLRQIWMGNWVELYEMHFSKVELKVFLRQAKIDFFFLVNYASFWPEGSIAIKSFEMAPRPYLILALPGIWSMHDGSNSWKSTWGSITTFPHWASPMPPTTPDRSTMVLSSKRIQNNPERFVMGWLTSWSTFFYQMNAGKF